MATSARNVFRLTFGYFSIGALALVVIVGTTLWLGLRAQAYFNEVAQDQNIQTAAVELRNSLETAESSQRGFLVSGNEIYLAPYGTAKADIQRRLTALIDLLAPYPDFSGPIDHLKTDVAQKADEMDQTITLRRAGHADEALAIFSTNRGKALMDEANVFLTAIIQFAEQRLAATIDEQRGNAYQLRWVSLVSALVIVAVVAGALYGLLRYTGELGTARDQLNALNDALEQRVSDRTADLSQARARAEALLTEVNHRIANSLSLVSSLVNLQSKSVDDPAARAALSETQDRIFAISLVHRRLYGTGDVRSVALDDYLAGLLDHLGTSLRSSQSGVVVRQQLVSLEVATDVAVNLGVIVTEWVTNAFKYAYPGGLGEVRVKLTGLAGDQAELVVEDDGVGRQEGAAPKGTGVGTRIVQAVATGLHGKITYSRGSPGTTARLAFSTQAKASPVAGKLQAATQ